LARPKKSAPAGGPQPAACRRPEASSLLRPEVGTQAQFPKKKLPVAQARSEDVSKVGRDQETKDWYRFEQPGLDVFDPGEGTADHRAAYDVPCRMLDADCNGLWSKATQVFLPRSAAWDDLQRASKGQYDDTVRSHLAGTTRTLFRDGEHGQVAIEVIDCGNELLVVDDVKEAR